MAGAGDGGEGDRPAPRRRRAGRRGRTEVRPGTACQVRGRTGSDDLVCRPRLTRRLWTSRPAVVRLRGLSRAWRRIDARTARERPTSRRGEARSRRARARASSAGVTVGTLSACAPRNLLDGDRLEPQAPNQVVDPPAAADGPP